MLDFSELTPHPSDDCTTNWTPDSHAACADIEVDEADLKYHGWRPGDPTGDDEDFLLYKWLIVREPILPEPDYRPTNYDPQPGT